MRWPPWATCRGRCQPERAAECFEQSLEIRRAAGDRLGEGWMLQRVAETRAALGQAVAAREAAAAAAALRPKRRRRAGRLRPPAAD